MRDLGTHRLVHVAPEPGHGGVGDFAADLALALRPHVGEVVEVRHGGPGTATARDLRSRVREVRRLVDEAPGRVVVHGELSGGAVEPFWSTRGLPPGVPATATVHDPPRLVWWPAATRLQARHPLLKHGLHYPLRGPMARLERWAAADRTLVTLSRAGAEALREEYPRTRVVALGHFVPERPAIAPAHERPRAVGLFGLVYRGKGFELLDELRRLLPDDVTIRVAGRGTREAVAPRPGVEVLGEVEGAAEDAFFASIRVLLVPYGPRIARYGDTVPASGTVAHARAYRTPVVCSDQGALVEVPADGGGVVAGDLADLAATAAALVDDPARLATLAGEAARLASTCTAPAFAARLAALWETM